MNRLDVFPLKTKKCYFCCRIT